MVGVGRMWDGGGPSHLVSEPCAYDQESEQEGEAKRGRRETSGSYPRSPTAMLEIHITGDAECRCMLYRYGVVV